MTRGQGIELGPLSFPFIRLLILMGFIRITIRNERIAEKINGLDHLMFAWTIWALVSAIFHKPFSEAFIFRCGIVFNNLGIYILIRVFCQTWEDIVSLCKMLAILVIPLSILMLYEKITAHNLFSIFGGIQSYPAVRTDGSVRAQGPFSHSILAGTIGAVCLPVVLTLWKRRRFVAIVSIGACLAIVYASNSSGPIMSTMVAIVALLLWRYRHRVNILCWITVFTYFLIGIFMQDPPYYIMAKIDLTGGSTGWHRAKLIETSINHLSEWWIGGTDYTRHWMAYGVAWSPNHVDITNYYLKMGVWGGLPLMILHILIIAKGLSIVVQMASQESKVPIELKYNIWLIGSALFTHAVTGISVSYFDQSYLFLYVTIGAIGSIWSLRDTNYLMMRKKILNTIYSKLKKSTNRKIENTKILSS